jgi:AbrB family looped-hinge helix DNA binding protein
MFSKNGICHGKMVFMNATAEIDKAGRLVVPKKMRDALHLVPGTRLTLIQKGDAIMVQPEARPRGLYWKNGMPVYEFGKPLPRDHADWVDQTREERADALMGAWTKD